MVSGAWPSAVAAGWYPVAECALLGRRPLARMVMDEPLVVFAGDQRPAVLRDRCPHRGMPLSLGRVIEGTIACPYHGWRFGGDGRCHTVPGARSVPMARACALPVIVRAGLVWTTLAAEPPPFPTLPSAMEDATLDRFWWAVAPSRARVLDAVENHLDPAHPHHVHPWLVRSPGKRRPTAVHVTIDAGGAEAVYREERSAAGLVPRLLEGERTLSIGRYFPPTIADVAFEGPDGLRLSVAVIFVPERADRVRPYAHFATPRKLAPAALKRWALKAVHWPILRQDRAMLAHQADGCAGAYATGPLDFLGPAIWGFANGRPPAPGSYTADVDL